MSVFSNLKTIFQHKIPLVTTGGTIATEEDPNGTRDVVDRDFNRLCGEELSKKSIGISETYPVYRILSENINFELIEKLVDQINSIIDADNCPKSIVITYGTDTLDKVINFLVDIKFGLEDNYPGCPGSLVNKINSLWETIENKNVALVFTAANDADIERDIKANINGAFDYAARKDLKPGIHVSFYEDHFLVYGDSSPNPLSRLAPEVYNPEKGMRFVLSSDNSYQIRLRKLFEYMNKMIKKLHDNFNPVPEGVQYYKATCPKGVQQINDYALKGDPEFKLKVYDLTKLRSNHEDFKLDLAKDKDKDTKAVLLVMNHGSTANAPDQNSEEYKEELSVEKLVKDLKREYPDLQFFATTVNYEPLDLNKYSSSTRIRDAGVVSLGKCPKELALAKLKILIANDITGDKLKSAMLKDEVGEMSFYISNVDLAA